jgi:ankyrin repeat protein
MSYPNRIYPWVLNLTEPQAGIDKLPPELLFMVAENLASQRSISRLSRANRYLNAVLTPYLIQYNTKTRRRRKGRRCALSWAATYGYEKLARAALATYPTLVAKKPLWAASVYGHAGIVRLLLEKDGVDIESRDRFGGTPLILAVTSGHEEVVKLLLKAGADPTVRPGKYRPHDYVIHTELPDPLLFVAVDRGYAGIVRLLLATGRVPLVSKDRRDVKKIPLAVAVENGHEEVVAALLAAGADPNTRGSDYKSVLFVAVDSGRAGIVALLLGTEGIDPDPSDYPDTPLARAAMRGSKALVEALLATGDVNVNFRHTYPGARTPLEYAVHGGFADIVQLFLDLEDLDRNVTAAVYEAAAGGHELVIRLLLARGNVDVTSGPASRRIPLFPAVHHPSCLKILLEAGMDPDQADRDGVTPLMAACHDGYDESVRLLLDTGHVDPKRCSSDGRRCPLYDACRAGRTTIVRRLLATGQVNVNAISQGDTPLAATMFWGRADVVEALLTAPDIDVNQLTSAGLLPLSEFTLQVTPAHIRAIRLVIATPGFDANKPDASGMAPLAIWSRGGNLEIVKLLLAAPGVNVNLGDDSGMTALHHAIYKSQVEVAALLLTAEGINIDAQDREGSSPLHFAAKNRTGAGLELLLSNGADPFVYDNRGRPPLILAGKYAEYDSAELLLDQMKGPSHRKWAVRDVNRLRVHRKYGSDRWTLGETGPSNSTSYLSYHR